MKDLNRYIFEKLKISKDAVNSEVNIDDILAMLSCNKLADKYIDDIKDVINRWFKQVYINDESEYRVISPKPIPSGLAWKFIAAINRHEKDKWEWEYDHNYRTDRFIPSDKDSIYYKHIADYTVSLFADDKKLYVYTNDFEFTILKKNKPVTEKLCIDKDVQTSHINFSKDDVIISAKLSNTAVDNNARLVIGLSKFKGITNRCLVRTSYDENKKIVPDAEIGFNSNGFYEHYHHGSNSPGDRAYTTVYMDIVDGIKFIKEIVIDYNDKKKRNLLYNYFDKEDEFIDDYKEVFVTLETKKFIADILKNYDKS